MKVIFGIALLAIISGCDTAKTSAVKDSFEDSSSEPAKRTYGVDRRPADGALIEITLTKAGSEYGEYDLTQRIASSVSDETTQIGDKLGCTFDALVVRCWRDDRIFGGALIEVVLVKSGESWTATRRVATYQETTGALDETTVLATGLSEYNSSDIPSNAAKRIFSVDRRPVDGALVEITLIEVGSEYNVTRRRAVNVFGDASDETDVIGELLTCNFAATTIFCSRDDRPSDGYLTEIKLIKSDDKWSATLRTAYYSQINGQSIDSTSNVGDSLTEVN